MGIRYRFANNLIVLVHSQALINNLLAISTSQNQAKNTTRRAGGAGGGREMRFAAGRWPCASLLAKQQTVCQKWLIQWFMCSTQSLVILSVAIVHNLCIVGRTDVLVAGQRSFNLRYVHVSS